MLMELHCIMVALALYEHLTIWLKSRGESTDEESVKEKMAEDLGYQVINERSFWDMFRNGLLHQRYAKNQQNRISLSFKFLSLPEFRI
ncbi:MAG: hypothetical protein H6672_18620 [Anaerolineaceae bacterium]|nr:hypothetical protein [Anaerolineaceae bacterium]